MQHSMHPNRFKYAVSGSRFKENQKSNTEELSQHPTSNQVNIRVVEQASLAPNMRNELQLKIRDANHSRIAF
jgi:hypothetical protein